MKGEFREGWPEEDPPPQAARGPEFERFYDHSEDYPAGDRTDDAHCGAGPDDQELLRALGGTALWDAPLGEVRSRDDADLLRELGGRAVHAELRGITDLPADTGVQDGHARRALDVPDLDLPALKSADARMERFSDPHLCWVPVDMIESTDDVSGELMDGDRDEYAAELSRALDAHNEGTGQGLDPRLVGDFPIRLCENPDTGMLEITGGRHRVDAAREAGLAAVVAELRAVRTEVPQDDLDR